MSILTIAAYAGSLSGWFVYEDQWLPLRESVTRSLALRAHGAVVAVFGDSPMPQRVLNLTWHLLNGALLGLLARRVCAAGGAIFAAGFFLLHPIQTESVAYVASRPELIAATWVLLALLAVDGERLWLAWLCAALAITGKEMAVMVWLLVPAWALLRDQWWSRRWVGCWALSAGLMLGAFTLRAWQLFGPIWAPWAVAAQWAELARLIALVPESLSTPSALTIDHDWSWITKPLAAAAVSGWLVAFGVAIWRRSTWALLLVGTPIVALLPRLLIPMPDGLHERHLYIPLIGVSLALALAFTRKESV